MAEDAQQPDDSSTSSKKASKGDSSGGNSPQKKSNNESENKSSTRRRRRRKRKTVNAADKSTPDRGQEKKAPAKKDVTQKRDSDPGNGSDKAAQKKDKSSDKSSSKPDTKSVKSENISESKAMNDSQSSSGSDQSSSRRKASRPSKAKSTALPQADIAQGQASDALDQPRASVKDAEKARDEQKNSSTETPNSHQSGVSFSVVDDPPKKQEDMVYAAPVYNPSASPQSTSSSTPPPSASGQSGLGSSPSVSPQPGSALGNYQSPFVDPTAPPPSSSNSPSSTPVNQPSTLQPTAGDAAGPPPSFQPSAPPTPPPSPFMHPSPSSAGNVAPAPANTPPAQPVPPSVPPSPFAGNSSSSFSSPPKSSSPSSPFSVDKATSSSEKSNPTPNPNPTPPPKPEPLPPIPEPVSSEEKGMNDKMKTPDREKSSNDKPIEAEVVSSAPMPDTKSTQDSSKDDPLHQMAVQGSLVDRVEQVLAEANLTPRHLRFCCGGFLAMVVVIALAIFFVPKLLSGDFTLFGGDDVEEPVVVTQEDPQIEDDTPVEAPIVESIPDASGQVWVDPSVYSGILLGGPQVLEDVELGIDTGILLGNESEDASDADTKFTSYLADLESVYNVYFIDVQAELDASTNRTRTLDNRIDEMKDLYNMGVDNYEAILEIQALFSASYDDNLIDKELAESNFFEEVGAFDGNEAEDQLLLFIEFKQTEADLRAKYFAFGHLADLYETVLTSLRPRIRDLELNREALIAGVQVVDVLESDLDLILGESDLEGGD